jgi:hypothetical protein
MPRFIRQLSCSSGSMSCKRRPLPVKIGSASSTTDAIGPNQIGLALQIRNLSRGHLVGDA